MVDDPKSDHLIHWLDKGNGFIITCVSTFSEEVLPNYYKHNKYTSFIRQLNIHDFYKSNRQPTKLDINHIYNHP